MTIRPVSLTMTAFLLAITWLPAAAGISYEEQQAIALPPPQSLRVTREGNAVQICWTPPPSPTITTAYDSVVATFAVYRAFSEGATIRRVLLGKTAGRCFIDRGADALKSAYVVTAITRSGHEGEDSDIVGLALP